MILYTLDIDERRHRMAVHGFVYLVISLLVLLFGAVYEYFSHEVYSPWMIYAFAFPLAAGTLPCMVFSLSSRIKLPCRVSANLYNSGIAAMTVGSIFCGVLEIYGTTNSLVFVYWIVGGIFTAAGCAVFILQIIQPAKR